MRSTLNCTPVSRTSLEAILRCWWKNGSRLYDCGTWKTGWRARTAAGKHSGLMVFIISVNISADILWLNVYDIDLVAYLCSVFSSMKRRLSMVIATLGDPKIVFLDEPTTGKCAAGWVRWCCWKGVYVCVFSLSAPPLVVGPIWTDIGFCGRHGPGKPPPRLVIHREVQKGQGDRAGRCWHISWLWA